MSSARVTSENRESRWQNQNQWTQSQKRKNYQKPKNKAAYVAKLSKP